MQGDETNLPEKAHEHYGDSYLAMDAANRKRLPQHPVRRKRAGWFIGRLKELCLLLVVLSVVVYFQRARILPWLAQFPPAAPLYQFIQKTFPVEERSEMRELATNADLVENDAGASTAGGETTFVSGQGFGTVSADDGSDSFRVVLPPEAEKK